MPRVSTDTAPAPKKAPRKRAVRRTISADEKPVRRTRVVEDARGDTSSVPAPTAARKAPTRLPETEGGARRSFSGLKVLSVFVVVVSVAAWVGFSDKGQIDVNTRINEANQNGTAENTGTTDSSEVIPVQNTPPAAISGLRPRGASDAPAPEPTPEPAPEAATSSATSTEGNPEETTEESTTDASVEEPAAETPVEDSAPPVEGEDIFPQ